MEIDLVEINNTPIFLLKSTQKRWARVYGAQYDKREERWTFPAFPPFLSFVVYDIKQIYPEMEYSARANDWIAQSTPRQIPHTALSTFTPSVPSLEHQIVGLDDILYNYRWVLRYQMGCGKTKIAIDQIAALNARALVVCPSIAVSNWEKEVKKFSSLTSCAVVAASKKGKREVINNGNSYDIIIASYDTARLYGMPRVYPAVISLCKSMSLSLSPALNKQLQRLSDETDQLAFYKKHLAGASLRQLSEEISSVCSQGPQWLFDIDYSIMVADELHRIKNIRSGRTKACLKLAQKAARRVGLTGTMSHGDPRDLYPQLKFLGKFIIPQTYEQFCKQHLVYAKNNPHVVVAYKNLNYLNILVNTVSSEKSLEDCVALPERRFIQHEYPLSREQTIAYNKAVAKWVITQSGATVMELQHAAIRVNKLLQLCSGFVYTPEDDIPCSMCSQETVTACVRDNTRPGMSQCTNPNATKKRPLVRYKSNPKLDALLDLLEDILTSGKVIIWTAFQEELADIEEALTKKGVGFVSVSGSTGKKAADYAEKFNTDASCLVYLAQISTGISITLNAAAYMVYYSRDWSLDHRQQSLHRNYRIGQTQKTVVYDLYARGTLEHTQIRALDHKGYTADLMTKKINCLLCSKSAQCFIDGTQPWSRDCILSTTAGRIVAKVHELPE